MSSYFSLPSFARARKNQEDLQRTNPQNPVLKDDDEKFLNKHIESDEVPAELKGVPPTIVTEGGEEKEASPEQKDEAGAKAEDQIIVPEEKPESAPAAQESKTDETVEESPATSKGNERSGEPAQSASEETAEPATDGAAETARVDYTKPEDAGDPPEQAPEEDTKAAESSATKAKKPKRNKSFELPSQEEAEAATRGFNASPPPKDDKQQGEQGGEKKTWTSYLPTLRSGGKKDGDGKEKVADEKASVDKASEQTATQSKPADDNKQGDTTTSGPQRTWAEYASSAYQSLPSIPSIRSSQKDSKAEPVYNEDGTINEEKTKEKQEKEVSVLLDRLNLSSINNRVFAFSGETEKIYERFAQVLKDTMNGAPTAYEDMDKLMKDAGPQLEKQFASMPPFVQTLVKSLPAKLGTTLGPELLAAASEKPGADMKSKMQAASKQSSSGGGGPGAAGPSITTSSAPTTASPAEDSKDAQQKKKRKIPGLKGLVSEQGAVASILRNVVNFLRVRFPFLASTTNVVMSLAVFILMFVFWYCHKRGKEVRLARELEAGEKGEGFVEGEDGEEEFEMEVTDEEGAEDEEAEDEAEGVEEEVAAGEKKGGEGAEEEVKGEGPKGPEETEEEKDAIVRSESQEEKDDPAENEEQVKEATSADLTAEKPVGVGS